jgi:SAM-dependent methyltransferase
MDAHANLYDYPKYYDLVFGSDWRPEFGFLMHCFRTHALRVVRRVFEPACGTGRLLFRLARAGLDVSGFDINERAVRYCNDRLERHGFRRSAFVADMAGFRLPRHADAAFNMINGFRHLTSERAARAHLRRVGDALHHGGLYVIGLHLTPTLGKPMERESWSARRGQLSVKTRMWTIERHLHRREERIGFAYEVQTPSRTLRLADEIVFRTYTGPQFKRLLRSLPGFEIAAIYDFNYDVGASVELCPKTEDAVFVLRKQKSGRFHY